MGVVSTNVKELKHDSTRTTTGEYDNIFTVEYKGIRKTTIMVYS